MHQRLTNALLRDIYHPVSAAISIGETKDILGVHLFDTMYGGERMRVEPDAKELWLISHHADGRMAIYDEDWQNLRRMRQIAGSRRVRLFLSGEDEPCREIGLSEELMNVL